MEGGELFHKLIRLQVKAVCVLMNSVFRALEHNFKIPFISLCILSYKSKESLWSEHSKLKSGSALGLWDNPTDKAEWEAELSKSSQ